VTYFTDIEPMLNIVFIIMTLLLIELSKCVKTSRCHLKTAPDEGELIMSDSDKGVVDID